MTLHIIGSPGSPYVRKVMGALLIKQIAFDFDPITPFFGNEAFEKLSPLRRIPVLIDGDVVVNDSSVIAEYIDQKWPEPPLYPADPADRARARWIEEYCDTRLGDLMIWGLFYQRVVGPRVFKDATDESRVERTLNDDLPPALDWLETQAPAQAFLFGAQPMVADLAVQMCFVNARLAGWQPDAARWPRLTALIERVDCLPQVMTLKKWVDVLIVTRPADQAQALRDAGAAVWEISHRDAAPRRGVMRL